MSKTQFLRDIEVIEFGSWVANRLDCEGSLPHEYNDRKHKVNWRCDSLYSAFEAYFWPFSCKSLNLRGKTFSESKRVLDELQGRLRNAVAVDASVTAASACIEILEWGGVTGGNARWISENAHRIGRILSDDSKLLTQPEPTPETLENLHRFNSGFAKIYSLLLEDVVIYDGRVGAALGALVRDWCLESDRGTVPITLCFPWGSPKEGKSPKAPKQRNPSTKELCFPKLKPGATHALWALRSSWLLGSVLTSRPNKFSLNSSPLRALEASLFMIGYDLWPKANRSITDSPHHDAPDP
jgi:hypothetical protein